MAVEAGVGCLEGGAAKQRPAGSAVVVIAMIALMGGTVAGAIRAMAMIPACGEAGTGKHQRDREKSLPAHVDCLRSGLGNRAAAMTAGQAIMAAEAAQPTQWQVRRLWPWKRSTLHT